MHQTKHRNRLLKAIQRSKNNIKGGIAFLAVNFIACSNPQSNKIDLPYSNVDSIAVIKREEGQSWEYAYRFTIKETEFFSSVYGNYINNGTHIRHYYARLPLHKYDFTTYRSDGKNDTFVLYQDYMQLAGFGVIRLPHNLEPLFDEAFKKDSLQRVLK